MREEIIKMAREAGLAKTRVYKARTISKLENTDAIERFFHMAQAAMVEQGWRKCAEGQKTTQFCGTTEKAVLEEREACAKVCEQLLERPSGYEGAWEGYGKFKALMNGKECAAAIRARGQA